MPKGKAYYLDLQKKPGDEDAVHDSDWFVKRREELEKRCEELEKRCEELDKEIRQMRPKMPKTAKKAGKSKAPRVRMVSCKKEPRNWIVRVAYCHPDECYGHALEMEVFGPFKDRYVAIEMLNRAIRDIGPAEVYTADGVKALADCRGQCELGEGEEKWSSWNYSEDGETAWCFFGDGHGYKGEVVEIPAIPAEGET